MDINGSFQEYQSRRFCPGPNLKEIDLDSSTSPPEQFRHMTFFYSRVIVSTSSFYPYLKQIPKPLLRILLNQIQHPLWNNHLSILPLHISKRHLHTLDSRDLDLWVIDPFDLLERDLVLGHDAGGADGGVGCHLDGTETAALEAFFAELGGAVAWWIVTYSC